MLLKLDLQLFASKKGVGSTKNGRDSHSKRLGAKLADGQSDDTLFALVNGVVKYERLGKDKKKVSVYPQA